MNTSLEIMSWNLRDGINDPAIQASILDIEPDIAVFPEAHAEDDKLDPATLQRFTNAGYTLYEKDYEDNDGRQDRHALVVAVKPEVVQVAHTVRTAGRNAIRLTLQDGAQFMGVHLDDRHERRRSAQARTVVATLGETAMVAGDFNSMHRDDAAARRLRVARPFANTLPAQDPAPGQKTPKLKRLGSLSQRLTMMADGSTMERFVSAGFTDADPHHVATMKKGPIAAQLDRIMYRGKVAVIRPTVVEDANNLSDHKRIRATLQVGR